MSETVRSKRRREDERPHLTSCSFGTIVGKWLNIVVGYGQTSVASYRARLVLVIDPQDQRTGTEGEGFKAFIPLFLHMTPDSKKISSNNKSLDYVSMPLLRKKAPPRIPLPYSISGRPIKTTPKDCFESSTPSVPSGRINSSHLLSIDCHAGASPVAAHNPNFLKPSRCYRDSRRSLTRAGVTVAGKQADQYEGNGYITCGYAQSTNSKFRERTTYDDLAS